MKISTLLRWTGPAAIASGLLMVFSDLLNLTIYVPGLGEAANTGYQAVGAGVILMAMTLLFVGMLGLYAGRSQEGRARVVEYGDARARYVLVEEDHEPAEAKTPVREDLSGKWTAQSSLRSTDTRAFEAARSHRVLQRTR